MVAQGIMWFFWPASLNEISPAQTHLSVEVLFNAAILHTLTVEEPGLQGAGVTGIQGIGVSVPMAAAVAAATIGLEGDLHMPNGGIFTMGMWSMMFAAITEFVCTVFGVGIRVLGATP